MKDWRKLLPEIAKFFSTSQLAELEIEGDEFFIRFSRSKGFILQPQQESVQAPSPVEEVKTSAEEGQEDHLIKVVAPLSGTFYRAPSPGAEPFVKEGSVVSPGDTLCIIEAMKVMNEIKAEQRGKVVKILGVNAEPVNEGDVIFLLDPNV